MGKRSVKQSRDSLSPQKDDATQQAFDTKASYTFSFASLADMIVASGQDVDKLLANVSPQRWLLALLTALIDPEGVRQTDSLATIPPSFHTALNLLSKINFYSSGSPQIVPQEVLAEGQRIRQLDRAYKRFSAQQQWRLNEGKRYSLEQAVNEENRSWCRYKTVRHLREFLERFDYPFSHFEGEPYITEAAYGKALEADRLWKQKLDRKRKERAKKKKASGNSKPASGKTMAGSGKDQRTSGKSKAASAEG